MNRKIIFGNLRVKSRARSGKGIQKCLGSMDGPKVGQIVAQRIPATDDGFGVLENVPGKPDPGAEVVPVLVVQRPLRQGHKAIVIRLGIIRQEI